VSPPLTVIDDVKDVIQLTLLQSGNFFQNMIVKERQIHSERNDEKSLTTKEWSVKAEKKDAKLRVNEGNRKSIK
jgi:ubiquitin